MVDRALEEQRALEKLLDARKDIMSAARTAAANASSDIEKETILARAKAQANKLVSTTTRSLLKTNPRPEEAALALVGLQSVSHMLTDENIAVLKNHPKPADAAHLMIELAVAYEMLTPEIKMVIKNHPDPFSIKAALVYQSKLEKFLNEEIKRLPESCSKRRRLQIILADLEDHPLNDIERLKDYVAEMKEIARAHRDIGLFGLFKFNWTGREPEGYKRVVETYDENYNHRLKA